jgi:two-component system KDP operon response regulator KdpE
MFTGCGSKASTSAKKDLTLTVYAGINEEPSLGLTKQFEKETGIKTNMVRMSGGELLARIKTSLRHSQNGTAAGAAESDRITVADLTIDYSKRHVSIGGKLIHLTPIEYRILVLLSKNIGKVLTYDSIIKEIWGPFTDEIYSSELQALRVNMANIRRKVESNPAEPRYIMTEAGVGYRMAEE